MNPIEEYETLVRSARAGRRVDPDQLDKLLETVHRSWRDFAVAVCGHRRPPRVAPGDACTHCATGTLQVYTSRRIGGIVEQRLKCNRCGGGKAKRIIPGHLVQRRCSKKEKTAGST